VTLKIASHQSGSYRISTPVYEGPLDLLLQLIERAELDITKLALAQVTDQYLVHMREMQDKPAEEVSAFLVIAARLIQIKSEALLPRPPTREPGEEDPGEALARQLAAYKKYREIAVLLGQREADNMKTYLRLALPPKLDAQLDLEGIGLEDLVAAARQVLIRADLRPGLKTVVSQPQVTIRDKISQISSFLRKGGRATFKRLLGDKKTRLDVVVTFLALLELVKRHLIVARQEKNFGDIEILADQEWDWKSEFELEFGE
jgi:segregation and condensation protein A